MKATTSKILEKPSVTFIDQLSTTTSPSPTADDLLEVKFPVTCEPGEAHLETANVISPEIEEVESPELVEEPQSITAAELQSSMEARICVYRLACQHFKVLPMTTFITNIHETNINLEHLGITPTEVHAISIPLRNIEHVLELNLSDNRITDEGAIFIFQILTFGNRIQSLNLSRNNLGYQSMLKMAEMLEENVNLNAINLSNNLLDDKCLKVLVSCLQESCYIITLDLSHNYFTENCAELMGILIEKNSYITSLDISWNMLGKKGARFISRGLQKNTNLEYFNISFNNIGNEGCMHLKNAIAANNTLKTFDLSTNNITADGVKMFARGLAVNTQLENLYLKGNFVQYEGVDALLAALLSPNSAMKFLDIQNVSINKEQEVRMKKLKEKKDIVIIYHPWVSGKDFSLNYRKV